MVERMMMMMVVREDENLSHDQVFDGLKDSVKYNNNSLFRRNVSYPIETLYLIW